MSQGSEHPDQAPARRSDGDWPDGGDIRGHVLVPVVWWREILLAAVLAAVLGSVVGWGCQTFLAEYEAEAIVMVNPQMTRVSVSGMSPSPPSDRTNPIPVAGRQGTLLGLVHQGEVVRAVLRRVGGQLSEKQRNLIWLLESTEGELVEPQGLHNISNLIRIETDADTPAKALAIVEAWVEEYLRQVNRLFSASGGLREAVEKQLVERRERYDLAQRELERHIERNRINELRREIDRKTVLVGLIQTGGRRSEELRIEAELARLEESYKRRRELRWLRSDAQGLRDLIESGAEASVESNRLAILLLKAQAFASSTALSDNLRLELDNPGAARDNADDQRADIEALITALQGRIEQLETVIADQSERLSNGASYWLPEAERAYGNSRSAVGRERRSDSPVVDGSPGRPIDSSADTVANAPNDGAIARLIASLMNDIQVMKGEMEAISAADRNFTLRRDRARNIVRTLERRSADLVLDMTVGDPRAKLASPATLSVRGGFEPFVAAIIGGFVGLIAAIIVAFLLDSAGLRPFLARRKVSRD